MKTTAQPYKDHEERTRVIKLLEEMTGYFIRITEMLPDTTRTLLRLSDILARHPVLRKRI